MNYPHIVTNPLLKKHSETQQQKDEKPDLPSKSNPQSDPIL